MPFLIPDLRALTQRCDEVLRRNDAKLCDVQVNTFIHICAQFEIIQQRSTRSARRS